MNLKYTDPNSIHLPGLDGLKNIGIDSGTTESFKNLELSDDYDYYGNTLSENDVEKLLQLLNRQAEAQENIHSELETEAKSRSRDDKKYFILNLVLGGIISLLVEHGPALIQFFLGLIPA